MGPANMQWGGGGTGPVLPPGCATARPFSTETIRLGCQPRCIANTFWHPDVYFASSFHHKFHPETHCNMKYSIGDKRLR